MKDEIEVVLKFKRQFPDENGKMSMYWSFADTMTTVDENEEELGAVVGCIGAWELRDKDETYVIRHDDVWYAFQKSLEIDS